MQVHLIRSTEYSKEQFTEVVSLLNSFAGPVRFKPSGSLFTYDDTPLEIEQVKEETFFIQKHLDVCNYMFRENSLPVERPVVEWENMFDICARYRKKEKIPNGELIILLTDVANENNWFSALDPKNTSNGFVHTGEWQYYVRCSGVFPVTYLIASQLLRKHMFSNYEEMQRAMHDWPLGCINDFCEEKRNIILKLRTADICHDCMHLLKGKLDPLVLQQMLDIFEGVRLNTLFNQNFRQGLKPSALKVTKNGQFLLPDYGNIEIRLRPLEKTLYLFFLNHPEGIMLSHLVDYVDEIRRLYFRFTTSGELPLIHRRIDDLVNATSNSANEKLSKIKKAFEKAIGEDLAKHYIVQGEHGEEKKILLPRQQILLENYSN